MGKDTLRAFMEEHDLFDNALISHGFADYMRDYQLVVDNIVRPDEAGMYQYLFKYCVEAHIETAVTAWRGSLDDRLLDPEQAARDGVEGYVWGVRWADLYPGWTLVDPSVKAQSWQERLGIDLHEVRIESNAFTIDLIFSILEVNKL